MSKSNIGEEFKRDAVRQITERGYPVAEVSQRLEAKDLQQHALPARQIGEGPICRARARL